MTYEYECIKCEKRFDVIKSVKDYDTNEFCPACGMPAQKVFSSKISFFGTQVEHAEFNPGLGCVVKNKYHRKELCKRRGLVEIGNDYKTGESHTKHFDDERARKRAKRWAED